MSTELVKAGTYDVEAAKEATSLWAEELGDDFQPEFPQLRGGGQNPSLFDPFSDPENPDTIKTFTGVIVGKRRTSKLYFKSFDQRGEGDSGRPDAWSADGKVQVVPADTIAKVDALNAERKVNGQAPLPYPLRDAKNCPYGLFGSAALLGKTGKGKARNEYLEIYLFVEGKPLPVLVPVSAGSIRGVEQYLTGLVHQNLRLSGVETVVSTQKQSGTTDYYGLSFTKGRQLTKDDADALKAYEIGLKPFLTQDRFSDDAAVETNTAEAWDQPVEAVDATTEVAGDWGQDPVAVGVGAVDTDDIDL